MVPARRHQDRRATYVDDGVECEEFGILRPGEGAVEGRDRDHGQEGGGRGNEMVERKRGPERNVKNAAAGGFERIPECREPACAKAFRPGDEAGARSQPEKHAPQGTDPVIVNVELYEPG